MWYSALARKPAAEQTLLAQGPTVGAAVAAPASTGESADDDQEQGRSESGQGDASGRVVFRTCFWPRQDPSRERIPTTVAAAVVG
jgi:hypothetical protein